LVEGKTVPTDGTRVRLGAAAGVLKELGVSRNERLRCCLEVAAAVSVTQREIVKLAGVYRYGGGSIWRSTLATSCNPVAGDYSEQTNESFCRFDKLSGYLAFDPFRGVRNKERIRVEREHHVQGATRVLFPRHLEGPQDAIGLHE
jgi:hypothetical protein